MGTQTFHHARGIFIRKTAGKSDQLHVVVIKARNNFGCNEMGTFNKVSHDNRVSDALAPIRTKVALELFFHDDTSALCPFASCNA